MEELRLLFFSGLEPTPYVPVGNDKRVAWVDWVGVPEGEDRLAPVEYPIRIGWAEGAP